MNQVRDEKVITPGLVSHAIADLAQRAVGGRDLSRAEKALLDEVAFSAGRVAVAARASRPPAIDGELDDLCWRTEAGGGAVLEYSNFFVLGKGTPAQFKTTFRLCHDGENLYVGARCEQDTGEFYIVSSGRDGRVWRDDSVEFLQQARRHRRGRLLPGHPQHRLPAQHLRHAA